MTIKQRGSGWSIRLVYNLYRLFGYKFIYYLMYPISFFYCFKAKNIKESLEIYYRHIGEDFTFFTYSKHLRHFAICMCDRFISAIAPLDYTFNAEDMKMIEEELKKGGILLSSHFGGWASASNSLKHMDVKVNIIMQEVMLKGIKDIEGSLRKHEEINVKTIDISKGGIGISISIAEALSRDEVVAMMGDRASSKKNREGIEFFGDIGYFNKNPFEIAYKTGKTLHALFISYDKPQTYKLDYIKIDINRDNKMSEEVSRCMQIYADRYASNIKQYPQGWFNFYDFWEK